MKKTACLTFLLTFMTFMCTYAQSGKVITEKTPSRSEYFSWINNTNEGATEKQTLVNLDFFKWLHDTYGMTLDIYAFDAGAIDGKNFYGKMSSDRFKRQFPNGFAPVANASKAIGTKLGLWGGPDGFGDTEAEAKERIDMMASLAEKYNFNLFKFDAVCGGLSKKNWGHFDEMMTRIRKFSPDFVLLNHRLDLGPGMKHATTFLLGGRETYIDVFMTNDMTAPHHRASALARGYTDKLTRLAEDHGVCLSSCLDYWEDELVAGAFGRELILAPEIYGNPWLLSDDEFPQFAFYFNLHRRYRDILVNGMILPKEKYGAETVSRGDDHTRFVVLRNLTWEPVTYKVQAGNEVGLKPKGKNVRVRLYHPYIYDMGNVKYGTDVEVKVMPYRAALVMLSNGKERDNVTISGVPYQIVDDHTGNATVNLLGMPGETYKVKVTKGKVNFRNAVLDGTSQNTLAKGGTVSVTFPGKKLQNDYFRFLGDMNEIKPVNDFQALYYATCYAADNNALEVRGLKRSGETKIPQVKAARDAFFNQDIFKKREIWDKNLFDGDKSTAFSIALRWHDHDPNGDIALMFDMGKLQKLDKIMIDFPDEYSLSPYKSEEGDFLMVSPDLVHWSSVPFIVGVHSEIDVSKVGPIRYARLGRTPLRVSEISAVADGKAVDCSGWHASNLFRNEYNVKKMWSSTFTLPEVPAKSYLCIAVNGNFGGKDNAWAALKIDGKYYGCPDRAPSFDSNTWEYSVAQTDKNYTYFAPLTPDMANKKIEVYLMTSTDCKIDPKVYINAYPIPFEKKVLTLNK